MKNIFKKPSKKNLNEYRQELARAHLIISLLSIAIITLLSLGATQPVTFNETLSAICIGLLTVVTIVSLCISITLFRRK